jgi:hypothetical protein
MNRRPDWVRKLLAVALVVGTVTASRAGSIAINPVNLSVNGTVQNIGQIDANLNGNTMDATFTLSAAWIPLKKCVEFQWLQVVTSLVADAGNPTYNMMALPIPIIDTPSGGYDGQVGEDALPWYLTAADIATNNLNGMNPNGSMFFMTNDTPSVKGATFDTWIVATTAAKEFCVIAGFEWGSGTTGGMATLKAKNADGFPVAANIATIGTALTNGAFAGYTAMRDCNIVCMIPEPSTVVLLFVAVVGAGAGRGARRRAA